MNMLLFSFFYDAQNISQHTLSYSHIFCAASERTLTEKTYMFILVIKLLFLIHLCHLRLYTVCLGSIIVSLNTTFSHFFMFALRFHKTFGPGNLF